MKYNLLIYFIGLLFIASSCAVPLGSIGNADYNDRKTLNKPQYEIKKKPFAITLNLTGAFIGALSTNNLVQYYEGTERTSPRLMNAAIGGVIGYGVTSLLTRMLGLHKNKIVYPQTKPELRKWISSQNVKANNYVIINAYSPIIKKSAESDYTVKNIDDVAYFQKAFPNSSYENQIIEQAIKVLGRDKLPDILRFYPNTSKKFDIGMRYLDMSKTISEYAEVAEKFPDIRDEAEKKAYGDIGNINNAIAFKTHFPNAIDYHEKIVDNLHQKLSIIDLGEFIHEYEGVSNINLAKNRLDELEAQVREDIENGVFTGKATFRYANGILNGLYAGNFVNGKREGYGSMTFYGHNEYNFYKGNWQDDKFDGEGKMTYKNGNTYEGDYKNGKKSGQGILRFNSGDYKGDYYTGNFENGQYNGYGEYYWTDGRWYKGEWKNDKKHGKGEFRGTPTAFGYGSYRYEGQWVNDKKEGQFTVWRSYAFNDYKAIVQYKDGNEISRDVIVDDFSAQEENRNRTADFDILSKSENAKVEVKGASISGESIGIYSENYEEDSDEGYYSKITHDYCEEVFDDSYDDNGISLCGFPVVVEVRYKISCSWCSSDGEIYYALIQINTPGAWDVIVTPY